MPVCGCWFRWPMVPVADRMIEVPIQTVVLDVPPQGAITKDNVTLSVDAVVDFRVVDAVNATRCYRVVSGSNAELRAVIDTPTDDWGISVDRDESKDIALPEGMRPRDGASYRCRWR